MASVRDVLEVFGAFDRAIAEGKDDPEVSAAADRLLPGSCANAGWHKKLERQLFGSNARTDADLVRALNNIATADQRDERPTQAQKVRLLYGISALASLKRSAPRCSVPSFDAGDDSDLGKALIGSLAAIGPTGKSRKDRLDTAGAARSQLLQEISQSFTRRQDFDAVRGHALTSIRFGTPLNAPLCQTAVVTVDGLESVVIDTKFGSDGVSLEDLKRIVNPFNWAHDYSELFVSMENQEPDILPDGWRRVLETVRLVEPIELTTPLKYYPYQDPARPFEARLDYDLDRSDFATGDGRVLVDRGFINMKAKNQTNDPAQLGVRVATRKVVHIKDISPFAQARLVCISGYGTGSADFLLRPAAGPPADYEPFDFPTTEAQADTVQPAAATPPPTIHCVPAAVGAWTEAVQDMTNGYFDIAQKWMSGGLTLADVADYSKRVGGGLASAPWKYLQEMTTSRPPGTQGGGT